MTESKKKAGLEREELERLVGEELPERMVMSTIPWDLTFPAIVPSGDELEDEAESP